jgi:hypothetical protein
MQEVVAMIKIYPWIAAVPADSTDYPTSPRDMLATSASRAARRCCGGGDGSIGFRFVATSKLWMVLCGLLP